MISRRAFLGATGGAIAASCLVDFKVMATVESLQPDHIILGCKDLDAGIAYVEKLSGYRAAIGGSHPGRGTRNALLKLGHTSYLEILAPDPAQKDLVWHKEVANLESPLLIGWAQAVTNIEQYAQHLREHGVVCTGPLAGSRTRPDGVTLHWRTLVREDDKAGILPFYIEWALDSPHPATDAPGACVLSRMSQTGQVIESGPPAPDSRGVHRRDMPEAQLHAFIQGRFGEFELKTRAIPSQVWSER